MTTPALDFSRFDPSVRPQDDLFRHVNGRWLATATIPDDRFSTGSFEALRDESEKAVHEICERLAAREDLDPASEEGKLAALYRSFMDEAAVEARGVEPLKPLLAQIDAIASVDDLRGWFGWCLKKGFDTLFYTDVDADPGDPGRYVLSVGQDGLGLPDESYYREPQHEAIREEYRAYIARTLALGAGRDQATDQDRAEAETVWELEAAIAATHWDIVKVRDMVAMYNPRDLRQLADEAPAFGWDTVWEAAGFQGRFTEVISCQPSFFPEVARLLTEARLDAWKAWARFHLTAALSPYLSAAFVEAQFDFYARAMTGQKALKPRWKRAVAFTEAAMGEALGKLYVAEHYPPEAERRMTELVANLLAAYRQSITDLDWMGEATKAEALKKLDHFRPKIGHPATWRDFSGLQVGTDLVDNVLAEGRFTTEYELGKLGRPVDPDEWFMYPQTVNAYYHPLRNEIVFPAAILQPPFFNVEADDAVNYGGIGAVIGHEIGHGFDDQGSTCDGDGRLRDWWTPEDQAAFKRATGALIAQYDALEPAQAPGLHVNGALTIGENIGDLGGLSIAIKAWRIATGGEAPEIDGYTGLQRLFLSWGTVWGHLARDERVAQLLVIDPHSPDEFRCNQTIRNIDDFYQAFGVVEGDREWLAPEDRVTIW